MHGESTQAPSGEQAVQAGPGWARPLGGGRESGFWGGEEEVEVVVVVMLEEDEGVDKGLAAWCSEDREDRQTGQTA